MTSVLLWDHDGVLVDTEGLYYRATRTVLASVGATLTHELYRQLFLEEGRGAWHLALAQGVDEAELPALKAQRSALYRSLLLEEDVVLEGAGRVLEKLGQRYRMAIVTSSHRDHFEAIHRHSGLPAHFELILTREDYVHAKPEPEPYLTALARMGVPAAESLVIEDSERGLRAAKAAGLRCWVIPSALTQGSSFDAADRRLSSLAELAEALL